MSKIGIYIIYGYIYGDIYIYICYSRDLFVCVYRLIVFLALNSNNEASVFIDNMRNKNILGLFHATFLKSEYSSSDFFKFYPIF